MAAPTFIKISFFTGIVRVEAWLKFALLPGVYVGEEGLEGALGFAVKGPLKQRVACVTGIISRYAALPNNSVSANTGAQYTNASPQNNFCTNCGAALMQGASFCSRCGTAIVASAAPQGNRQY